jgi:predicted dehydrogenase
MSAGPVSIVLSGIGGMGAVYLKALLDTWDEGRFRLEGTIDPVPERSPHLARLKALRVPVYPNLESFYHMHEAEFAIISSPIQFHAPQTCLALERGSHVLCEKPAAATVQEIRDMIEARDRAVRDDRVVRDNRVGRRVAVGFQWSFSDAIQSLKADIRQGRFGAVKRMKCLYTWPRDLAYYGRNDWAGKRRDSSGAWILDSPANNAMAHDLHNIFYVLGREIDACALPVEVEAELYRAYDIDNFDTAAVRLRLDGGAEILFLVSHVSRDDTGPVLRYEFERGDVTARGRASDILAAFADGSARNYGSPDAAPLKKLWDGIESVRTGAAPVCGLEAALGQTLAVDGMQDAAQGIAGFPKELVRFEPSPSGGRRWVEGLDDVFARCYEEGKLPSEIGAPWGRASGRIDLRGYRRYPSRPA